MESLIASINEQASRLFVNTEHLLAYVDDGLLTAPISKWPLWRQIYHMLHSMDQWFINPFEYEDERDGGFDLAALNTTTSATPLTKSELSACYARIKNKTVRYLESLTVQKLSEHPPGAVSRDSIC